MQLAHAFFQKNVENRKNIGCLSEGAVLSYLSSAYNCTPYRYKQETSARMLCRLPYSVKGAAGRKDRVGK
jgi:hypothetical protein